MLSYDFLMLLFINDLLFAAGINENCDTIPKFVNDKVMFQTNKKNNYYIVIFDKTYESVFFALYDDTNKLLFNGSRDNYKRQ